MANNETTVQIIPYYSHPHVHTVINDNSFYDETVVEPTSADDLPFATCIVTGADMGIDNKFVRLDSLKTKQKLFGRGDYLKYGQPSIQADVLFNGNTNVWFCRVLPDNARYANIVVLAHYRKGKILDELGQETGKYRMEIKFSTVYADKPYLEDGALSDALIEEFARSNAQTTADANTGYLTLPVCYIRSTGRGKYGNNYSISIDRDVDAEKEYNMKMYKWSVITNELVTKVENIFAGSLYQASKNNVSTLISDVIDQYSEGSCPVYIYPFEDNFEILYSFYKGIVEKNRTYISTSGGSAEDLAELAYADAITMESFDPLFGYKLNTKLNEVIPYYRNYTEQNEPWKAPDLTIPNNVGAAKPLNIAEWATAYVGAHVLVIADPLNKGYRWMYSVVSIDKDTGNIVYDEGEETEIDADQYTGEKINVSVGMKFAGGHDGDFEEITVNGETRSPSSAEMKLLLSREFVKAFRGEKDRAILSPARINIDFMFDANYNLTTSETLSLETNTVPLYNNSTVITDKDANTLAILGNSGYSLSFTDLNVKQAMYDLNEFRCRNGMTINPARGAGCSLYLDCGLVGLKNIGTNEELKTIIVAMNEFEGRQTSVDLGYYSIFDPKSGKKVDVTVTYYIAKKLIPHLIKYGLNKPFVYNYAQITAIQKDKTLVTSGEMIRDSFRPEIDLIDWDVKEDLYKSRINYYLATNEGRTVQRACQNTRQTDASALLEENNVRVLNTLKKGLEKACRNYLYEWNEPEVRKGYTQAQMEVYRPWIGTMVQDLDIRFEANEWEQERMMMHCYCEVAFRDIVKRIILEININRPNYNTGGES